jgi:sugar (pentulose or hexulose) kinase
MTCPTSTFWPVPGHVIGIDVGSQSVKAALLDPDGATVATAGRPCAMSHPEAGWAEQDPAEWERALAGAVRAVIDAAGVRAVEVTHLGLACQVDGVVAVDDRLDPLRDAIIWLDRRAVAETDALTAAVGADALFTTTGLAPDASHTAPKMMWLREHEPEVYRAARSLPPVAGYLLARLTGVLAQDAANASSTLLYDVRRAPGRTRSSRRRASTRACCRPSARRTRSPGSCSLPRPTASACTRAAGWSWAPATSTPRPWAPVRSGRA